MDSEYKGRMLKRRLKEAGMIVEEMKRCSNFGDNDVRLSLQLFSKLEEGALSLADKLKGDHTVSMRYDGRLEVWLIVGTSIATTVIVDEEQIFEWVREMFELGASYGAVLASWKCEDVKRGIVWNTEEIEVE